MPATTTLTPAHDVWTLVYDAALAAVTATRSSGRFGNTTVYAAVATCGVTPTEARSFDAQSAIRAAFDTHAERQTIIAAIGEYL